MSVTTPTPRAKRRLRTNSANRTESKSDRLKPNTPGKPRLRGKNTVKLAKDLELPSSESDESDNNDNKNKPKQKRRRRRSMRLKEKKVTGKDNETDFDESDSDDQESDYAITQSPKKKRKITRTNHRKKKSNIGIICVRPSFVSDIDNLTKIGIAYKNKKGFRKYHSTSVYQGRTYHWKQNKKYHLIKIVSHRISFDRKACNLTDSDDLWFDCIRNTVKNENKETDGNNDDNDDDNDDNSDLRLSFGRLIFECKWEKWPVRTWEKWSTIQNTPYFDEYCKENNWSKENQLIATIDSHSNEEFGEILSNIAHFGTFESRKAMKIIFGNNLSDW